MLFKYDDKYDVGSGEQFDDLVGLIEHFRSYPMIETSGDVLRLLQPVSGTCVRARDIDRKVHEMEETDELQRFVKNGFDGEFQSLWLLEERQAFTTDEGEKLQNATKNRYRNVLPYDHSRVVLRRRDYCPGESDYINASHIRPSSLRDCFSSSSNESLNSVHSLRLYSEPKRVKSSVPLVSKSLSDEALQEIARCVKLQKMNENVFQDVVKDKSYIATQGCLQSTRADFWQMVWQEDVRIIAMIANEVEKGKKKCDRYWPSSGSEEKFDALTVRSVSETFYENYLVRELEVCDQRTCRTIYQYQFTAWPDHGTPPEPDGVLAYLDDMNRKMYQISQSRHAPQNNVICVHCSAGVGRTGTFIVLDILIDQIKSSGYSCDIDVYNTVKLVRSCRKGMVQNRAQYKFIYLALQQYIDNKNLKLRKKVYTSDA